MTADESHLQLKAAILTLIFIVGIMKIVFAILLLIHGLIHVMGFAKAFSIGDMTKLYKLNIQPF